jgi:hypothetical protein
MNSAPYKLLYKELIERYSTLQRRISFIHEIILKKFEKDINCIIDKIDNLILNDNNLSSNKESVYSFRSLIYKLENILNVGVIEAYNSLLDNFKINDKVDLSSSNCMISNFNALNNVNVVGNDDFSISIKKENNYYNNPNHLNSFNRINKLNSNMINNINNVNHNINNNNNNVNNDINSNMYNSLGNSISSNLSKTILNEIVNFENNSFSSSNSDSSLNNFNDLKQVSYNSNINSNVIWSNLLTFLRKELNIHTYNVWIKPIEFNGIDNNVINIKVQNHYFKNWLEDHCLDIIKKYLKETNLNYDVMFFVA